MRLQIYLISLLILCQSLHANAQVNSTEIWVLDVSMNEGKPETGAPLKITDNTYYDNQPCFNKDASLLYYVSMPDTVQTDIFEYNIRKKTYRQITNTPESEYQPQPIPYNRDKLSFIRVESNKSQTLMAIAIDGSNPYYLMENEDSVAYYCWLNDTTVGAYMLNGAGGVLEQFDMKPQQAIQISVGGFGRCIAKIPGTNDLCYVKKSEKEGNTLMRFEFETQMRLPITVLPEGVEDYCWGPDGKVYCGKDARLWYFDSKEENGKWHLIADYTKTVGNFYRLAMSQKGDKLALVSYRGAKP